MWLHLRLGFGWLVGFIEGQDLGRLRERDLASRSTAGTGFQTTIDSGRNNELITADKARHCVVPAQKLLNFENIIRQLFIKP